MKLKKLTAFLIVLTTTVCVFSQVNLKNMSAEELIDLKADIEKELFSRKPEAFSAAKNPLEGLSFSRKVGYSWSTYTTTYTLTFGSNGTLVYREERSDGQSEVIPLSYSVDAENRIYTAKFDDRVVWGNYGNLFVDFYSDVYVRVGTKFSLQDAKPIAGNTYCDITGKGDKSSFTFNRDGTCTWEEKNESHTSTYLVDPDAKVILYADDKGWQKLRYTEDGLTIGIGGMEMKKK